MRRSRRDFLATSVVFPVLSLDLANAQPSARSKRRGPKIGIVTYNIAKDWDIETIVKNLTEVGMEGVELRTQHRHGVEISLTAARRAEVRKRFEDSPIKIAGLGTTCEY